ncbi:RidA family protein [Paenibacillus kobensis]|uniref:RidA family protein n=1 Tax=Paenibacillus kobensis TaxID=59841 RepID=UPI000FDCA332|nr:RidA family protein [Paenibacillus kobensis]
MSGIIRSDINEEYVYSGIVEAGEFVFLSFCAGNIGAAFEEQVDGAIDDMERRLHTIGLTLEAVVKIDVLLKDVWNISFMEKVFARRFIQGYPARKTISTEFAHAGGMNGLQVQIDAIAYKQ